MPETNKRYPDSVVPDPELENRGGYVGEINIVKEYGSKGGEQTVAEEGREKRLKEAKNKIQELLKTQESVAIINEKLGKEMTVKMTKKGMKISVMTRPPQEGEKNPEPVEFFENYDDIIDGAEIK